MISNLYLMQQALEQENAVGYSVGLVIVCLVLLMLLWLPDVITKD
ncbi:conserved hypothetical protein [Hyella patelloides LEGE 07179]|uniref:Uncharacterized protein n=1 Tax=Hyella patelloides LEGE 07179 TaxID=945734 RepID=A0A563VTW7_9CYAN|nr:conserved hypothetical protein [Hyella patelloides LEGE 07179]